MQLLQMIQDVYQEDQRDDYVLSVFRSRDMIRGSMAQASPADEAGHAMFRVCDPYNRFCDHILVYDRVDNALVASTRVLAWEHIAHLSSAGGFVSQGCFDLSGLSDTLPQTVELSRTYIAPEHRNGQVMMKLWVAIMQLLQDYQARYLIGVLSLNPWQSMTDVRSLMRDTEGMMITDCTRPILARNPIDLSAVSASYNSQAADYHARAQLQAIGACLGQEVHADEESESMNFFVRVDARTLLPRFSR